MQDIKPKAAEAIINNSYVDDIFDPAVDAYAAKKLTFDVDEVLATGGFQVKKWTSNVALDSKESSEEVLFGGETHAEKVLGTVWLPKEDTFSFKIKIESAGVNDKSTKLTKRQILSKLAGIFHPVGAGAAVLIKLKVAMQQRWQIGLGWDEEVPPNARESNGWHCLKTVCVASRLAFGACAYARWKLVDGKFRRRFFAAKARVTPLKELTIPCLELQVAVLGSHLGKSILQESRFNFKGVHYLSDSRVALAWIKGETQLQTLCFLKLRA